MTTDNQTDTGAMTPTNVLLTKNDLKDIQAQLDIWYKHVNTISGMTLFILSMSCFSTPMPWLWAVVSFLLVLLLMHEPALFPEKIRAYRIAAKNGDENAKTIQSMIDKQYFGMGVMLKRGYGFFIGLASILSVIIYDWVTRK